MMAKNGWLLANGALFGFNYKTQMIQKHRLTVDMTYCIPYSWTCSIAITIWVDPAPRLAPITAQPSSYMSHKFRGEIWSFRVAEYRLATTTSHTSVTTSFSTSWPTSLDLFVDKLKEFNGGFLAIAVPPVIIQLNAAYSTGVVWARQC